jgi:hypothetical protein
VFFYHRAHKIYFYNFLKNLFWNICGNGLGIYVIFKIMYNTQAYIVGIDRLIYKKYIYIIYIMMTTRVKITDVNKYIKNSPVFFLFVKESINEYIDLPKEFYFTNFDNLDKNYENILTSILYWNIKPIPKEIIDYYKYKIEQNFWYEEW